MASNSRILIVEDSIPQAKKMQLSLRKAGYDVPDYATDGASALELAAKLKPDLALVDIKLPDIDGVDIARRLRDEWGIKVVFVTAHGDEATMRRALEVFPVDFLVKPISSADLCEAVEWALMGLPRLEVEIQKLLPHAEHWLMTPNEGLGGLTPKDAIGTRYEVRLRQMLRAAIQGMLT